MAKREFDPDQLNITKDQLISVLNAVIKRWKKNAWKNKTHIIGANTFKLGILATPDEIFNQLWTDLIKFSNELIAYNEMMRLKNEMPKTQDFLDLFIQKIESGKFVE